jgi:hypothetical protein
MRKKNRSCSFQSIVIDPIQSSVVAYAGKTDRVIMIGLTTLGHAHRFGTHGLL